MTASAWLESFGPSFVYPQASLDCNSLDFWITCCLLLWHFQKALEKQVYSIILLCISRYSSGKITVKKYMAMVHIDNGISGWSGTRLSIASTICKWEDIGRSVHKFLMIRWAISNSRPSTYTTMYEICQFSSAIINGVGISTHRFPPQKQQCSGGQK